MEFNLEDFNVDSVRNEIIIADSFVENAQKIGKGHGEKKLYIGNRNEELYDFFGKKGFRIKCFIRKSNLIRILDELQEEYLFPKLPYKLKDQLPKLYKERKKNIEAISEELLFFDAFDLDHLKPPRCYIRSKDSNYNFLRKIPLPRTTYINFKKLINEGVILYEVALFCNYEEEFGTKEHPKIIEEIYEEDDGKESNIDKARKGQGKFRANTLGRAPFCPITLVTDDRILEAAHIKPWKDSNNLEKLDGNNGIMMTPTIHKLFDRGFISFTDDEKIILSSWVPPLNFDRLKIKKNQKCNLSIKSKQTYKYLDWHRSNIFKN